MSDCLDTVAFRRKARVALGKASHVLGTEMVAEVFDDILALCAEVERYRKGAQTRTQEQAARLAAMDCELAKAGMAPGERQRVIAERNGCSVATVYRQLKLVRHSHSG